MRPDCGCARTKQPETSMRTKIMSRLPANQLLRRFQIVLMCSLIGCSSLFRSEAVECGDGHSGVWFSGNYGSGSFSYELPGDGSPGDIPLHLLPGSYSLIVQFDATSRFTPTNNGPPFFQGYWLGESKSCSRFVSLSLGGNAVVGTWSVESDADGAIMRNRSLDGLRNREQHGSGDTDSRLSASGSDFTDPVPCCCAGSSYSLTAQAASSAFLKASPDGIVMGGSAQSAAGVEGVACSNDLGVYHPAGGVQVSCHFTVLSETTITLQILPTDPGAGSPPEDPASPPLLGGLKAEYFTGLPGGTLVNLTSSLLFPNYPDLVEVTTQFESRRDWADYYGARLSGWLIPPVTGDYRFYLASDDQGALFLSTDESPANKLQIASEPGWNGYREYVTGQNQASRGNPPVNISTSLPLVAGQAYYVEALLKEGQFGDHLSVAWQIPGDPTPANGADPIPGPYLASSLHGGVLPPNSPPVTVDDLYTTFEDTVLNVPSQGVLANDTDPDGDPLTVTLLNNGPAHAAIFTLYEDGSFAYLPATNYFGPDSFTYTVSDGHGGSSSATVNITVTPVNDAPSFVSVGLVTARVNSPMVWPDWATEASAGPANEAGQTLSFLVTDNSNPGLFSVAPVISPDGTLSFTPAPNTVGTAQVTVALKDNGGTAWGGVDESAWHTFTIRVNSDPVAKAGGPYIITLGDVLHLDGSASFDPDATMGDSIGSYYWDLDGDGVFSAGEPRGVAANVTSTELAALGVGVGTHTILLRVFDNFGFTGNDSTTLTINPAPVNHPPVAMDDAYTTDEEHVLTVGSPGLLGNDTDPDAGPLVRFSFAGHVVSADADFSAGERFTGFYVVDPAATRYDIADSTLKYQYRSDNVPWEINFPDRGYRFVATSAYTWIMVGNDISFWGDRYIAVLTSASNLGTPLPSGRMLNTVQLDLWDPASAGADLLSDDSVQTTSVNLAAAESPAGRLAFRDGTQPQLVIDQLVGPLTVIEINGQATSVNTPITLASGATLRVNSNGSFSYDPRGHFDQLPSGQTATETFTYEMSDADGATASATVTITIQGMNDTPVLANAIPAQTAVYGGAFSLTIPANTFSDVDAAQPLTYIASGMPPGIVFDAATRTFSGAPTVVGTFAITVTASDEAVPPLSASTTFNLVVGKAALTVTADSFTRFYGEANPTLTGTLVSVVNGDNITATYTTTATPAGPTGVYTINVTLNDPNNRLGNYNVTTVTGALRVERAPQTITFGAIPAHVYGDAPFTVPVSASSGLPVTLTSSMALVGTVSGNTFTVTGAGATLLTAYQPGDANYQAAMFAQTSYTVGKAAPVITWAAPADIPLGTALSAAQLNATANVPGTFTYDPPAGTVLYSGNAQVLTASFTPDDSANYGPASATTTINVLFNGVPELWAWGYGADGELGNGQSGNSSVPVAVSVPVAWTGHKLKSVTAGYDFNLALLNDGSVWAWGNGDVGQLGNGQTGSSAVPVAVSVPVAWSGRSVVSVVAGGAHSLAVLNDGSVWAWGFSGLGQLGNGPAGNSSVPVAVTAPPGWSGRTVASVAAGLYHSLILLDDGSVWAWGYGAYGQLGNGQTDVSFVPEPVPAPGAWSGRKVLSVAAGALHSLALLNDGSVWAWGFGVYGQLGNGQTLDSTVPVEVSAPAGWSGRSVVNVAAGRYHSVATLSDGSVWTWGYGEAGVLGNGQAIDSAVPVALSAPAAWTGHKVASMAAGGHHNLTVLDDGSVWAWGYGYRGALGNGQQVSLSVPVAVSAPMDWSGRSVLRVAAGLFHSLALVGEPNIAPAVANSIATQNATYGTAFSFTVPGSTFSDADAGQSLTYSANGLPAWLSFNANTRTFSGTPPALGSSTVTVTATDSGTPGLSASTTFDIVVGKASLTVTTDSFTRLYGEANPPLTGTLVSVVNGDNITATYTTTATPTGDAGVYTIFPVVNDPDLKLGNYTLTLINGALRVNPASQTISFGSIPAHAYGDAPFVIAATTGSDLPVTLASSAPSVATVSANTITIVGAGTTIITATQTGDGSHYPATPVARTLTVARAPVTVTALNQTSTYGKLPTLAASYTGFVNGDTAASLSTPVTLTTPATTSSIVGTYPITASGATAANYDVSFSPGTLTIVPAILTVTADNKTKVYGAALPALTLSYSGFVNGDTAAILTRVPTLSTTAKKASVVGDYPIVLTGGAAANYQVVPVNGTLSVTRAPLTVTPANKSNVYGTALPTLTATYAGFVNGDGVASLDTPVSMRHTAEITDGVGIYPIQATGASDANYTVTFVDGTLTITPHALTIRAQNKTKTYGATVPALTATYSGFVNGDTAASLDTPVILESSGTDSSAVGTYAITARGASGRNYTITFAPGTLTVNPAILTVKAQNTSKIYGAALPPLPYTFTGFVLGDTEVSLDTPVVITTTAAASSNVGSYPIQVSGATDANYTVRFVNGTFSVSKAPLTITADNKSKTRGTVNPAFTASYAGFVNGDMVASLDTPVAFTTTATTTSPVGSYPITPKNAKDVNYTVTFVNGTLTVAP